MFDYDAELACYHAHLMAALDIDPAARVLDIGCGTGRTTRVAARAAPRGRALGVDISAPMLARARLVTDPGELPNVTFEQGDAQVHPLPPAHFTIGISRFGTMFFADQAAAFAHIARGLAPGARFVQLVWQESSRQEWHGAIRRALTGEPATTPATEAAFSLADPAKIQATMTNAGFTDVQLIDLQEPVYYGADGAAALLAVRTLGMTDRILRDLDQASAERAVGRLRDLLDARDDGGVRFDSRAWLVIARRL